MALIAGLGRWRRRHVMPEGTTGLTPREAGGLLRTALPLVSAPEHAGKGFGIEIGSKTMERGEAVEVWASIGSEGRVLLHEGPLPEADARARGNPALLVDAILDGSCNGIRADGEGHLVESCLSRLHTILWAPSLGPSPAAAEAVAAGGGGAELSHR
jgi:hypothetical protein